MHKFKIILGNLIYLLGTVFTNTISLVKSNDTVYNKTFLNKFKKAEDRQLLEEAVKELKESNDSSPKEITLSNGHTTTIVVN